MARQRGDDERDYRQDERWSEEERLSAPRQRRGPGEGPYQVFGGLDLRERMQGPRERGGWRGGPYETGGFQGGGGYAPDMDRGFDFGGEGRGGYRGAEGYQGGDRYGSGERYGSREGSGERERLRGGERYGRFERYGAGELHRGEEGLRQHSQAGGGQRPSSRVAADYDHFGGQGDPGWGDTWGAEEQTGWRGPGEMPGYRASERVRPHFHQSSSGGQIPGEFRNWSRGPHAGRGPRGYRRSDDRIHAELCDRLTEAPDIDATDLEVEVRDGRVILSGGVPDRWMKHRAEDLADAVLGVTEVENRVRVLRRGDAGSDEERPAGNAPTRPRGHGSVLHADAPELLGAPGATGDADAERRATNPQKGRTGTARGNRPGGRGEGGKH